MKYIGEDIGALPSRQLVAGKGQYVGDLQLDGLLQQRGHDDPLAHSLDEFHSENFSPR